MRNVALLGSTGSIGTNTLEVLAHNPDSYKLISLAAGTRIDSVRQQIRQFQPEVVCVKKKADALSLRKEFPGTSVYHGPEGLLETVAHPRVDTMVSAIDGTVALEATLYSIRQRQRICLANKETLVAAGQLINREQEKHQTELIPIDSEQSAIFQSIGNNHSDHIRQVILTASGGPFFRRTLAGEEDPFKDITVKDALAHPTWSMGTKITVDSATMMNKALEVIEAFYLFRLKEDQIDVVIHPQSIVHSMVEFIDNSVIAQLSVPDMKLPILYSLSYPHRVQWPKGRLNLTQTANLEFHKVNTKVFRSIDLAYQVLKEGKSAGAVFNAANEIAVQYFLAEQITFKDIFRVVTEMFQKEVFRPLNSLQEVNDCIAETRIKTKETINRLYPGTG